MAVTWVNREDSWRTTPSLVIEGNTDGWGGAEDDKKKSTLCKACKSIIPFIHCRGLHDEEDALLDPFYMRLPMLLGGDNPHRWRPTAFRNIWVVIRIGNEIRLPSMTSKLMTLINLFSVKNKSSIRMRVSFAHNMFKVNNIISSCINFNEIMPPIWFIPNALTFVWCFYLMILLSNNLSVMMIWCVLPSTIMHCIFSCEQLSHVKW